MIGFAAFPTLPLPWRPRLPGAAWAGSFIRLLSVSVGAESGAARPLAAAADTGGDHGGPDGQLPPEEAALLARLKAGDERAYADLLDREGPRLLAVARRMLGSDADAQDCLQESLTRAFRALPDFEGRSRISTWLHRIVVNDALMVLRKRKRRDESSLEELLPSYDDLGIRTGEPHWRFEETAEDMLARADVAEAVRDAIRQLPEAARTVIVLRDLEELSTEEVAEMLDVSAGAVKVRLHRARAALKTLLEPVFARGEV